jgi:hypothetical protein
MICAKSAVQNHSPVYAGPRDRRQTCPESAAKNSSTASGHARDLMGPSADISRSLGLLVSGDFVGSKREMSQIEAHKAWAFFRQ